MGVAAGDDDFGEGILGVDAADGSAGGAISIGGYGAGIEDNKFGGFRGARFETAIRELACYGSTVGLRRATAKIFDVVTGHPNQW